MQNWQTIESAPKDGTAILVYPGLWTGRSHSIARYELQEHHKNPRPYWLRDDSNGSVTTCRERPPTHWMPLPEPPKDVDDVAENG